MTYVVLETYDLDNMKDRNVTATNTAAAKIYKQIAAQNNNRIMHDFKDHIDFGIDDGGEFTRSSTQRLGLKHMVALSMIYMTYLTLVYGTIQTIF